MDFRKKRKRRGSVLVLVALMLTVMMGVAAIAADIGRFYVVASELQTGADAAALVGAAVLQRTSSDFESTVDDSVTAWASTTNRADGASLSVPRDSVSLGYWIPGVDGATGNWRGFLPGAVQHQR